MNETTPAAPTFYEITPIPYIAWEPSVFSWILLGSLFIMLMLIGRLLIRHKDPELRGSKSLYALVRSNAARCLEDFKRSSDTVHLTRLSLDIRNFLALLEFPDARSLTAGELRSRAESTPTVQLKQLAAALAELDQFEYSPEPSTQEGFALGQALVQALESYITLKATP